MRLSGWRTGWTALVVSVACYATPKLPARLAEAIALDSAVFAAVVDTLRVRYHGDMVFGISPVPVDTTSLTFEGYRKAELHAVQSEFVAARRAVLVSRGVSILDDATAGACPGVFSAEATDGCPEQQEDRISMGLVREAKDSVPFRDVAVLSDGEIGVIVQTVGLGRSGAVTGLDEYILRRVDGRWKVVRVFGIYAE